MELLILNQKKSDINMEKLYILGLQLILGEIDYFPYARKLIRIRCKWHKRPGKVQKQQHSLGSTFKQ